MLSRPDHSVFLNQSGEMSHCVKLVDKNWHWEDRGMDVRQLEGGREWGDGGEWGKACAWAVGVGNISLLSYIVILRAHDNRIVVVLKLSSYRVHIISGVVFAEIRHAVAK